MSFVRPDAKVQIARWRETLVGVALWVPGVWWAFFGRGLMPYIGALLLIIGAFLIAAGLQRARFRVAGRGPGVVRVTEDQIAYFGPLTGGVVALDDLARLSLDRTGKPAHWVLSQLGQPDLHIPVTAGGAEALFDAFARLPGLRTEHMLTQLNVQDRATALVWQRQATAARQLK